MRTTLPCYYTNCFSDTPHGLLAGCPPSRGSWEKSVASGYFIYKSYLGGPHPGENNQMGDGEKKVAE